MPGVRLERLKTASWSSRRFRPCKNILVKVPSFSELGTKHRKNHPRTAGLMPGARDSCHGFESLKIQLGKPNPKPWPQHPHGSADHPVMASRSRPCRSSRTGTDPRCWGLPSRRTWQRERCLAPFTNQDFKSNLYRYATDFPF